MNQPSTSTAERKTEIGLSPKICIVAGEASGDAHSALLVEQLKALVPSAEFFGMGGAKLRAAGVDTVVDCDASASVMGITELFGSLKKIVSAFNEIVSECERRDPKLVIVVDYPDFNLRLVKKLKKPGRKILYFISPQLWAWRSGRVETIRKYVDFVAAIFPFEEQFYKEHGIRAEYVGHPFVDEHFPEPNREDFFKTIGGSQDLPAVALLPGSRKSEVELLLEPLIGAFELLRNSRPGVQAVIPLAPAIPVSLVKKYLPQDRTGIFLLDGQAREVLVNCDFALVASGTATVEAALAAIPFAAVYRLSKISYFIARRLVRGVTHFAMPNLIVGSQVVAEYLQNEATAERLHLELERLMADEHYRKSVTDGLQRVRAKLLTGVNASARAAEIARHLLLEG